MLLLCYDKRKTREKAPKRDEQRNHLFQRNHVNKNENFSIMFSHSSQKKKQVRRQKPRVEKGKTDQQRKKCQSEKLEFF